MALEIIWLCSGSSCKYILCLAKIILNGGSPKLQPFLVDGNKYTWIEEEIKSISRDQNINHPHRPVTVFHGQMTPTIIKTKTENNNFIVLAIHI